MMVGSNKAQIVRILRVETPLGLFSVLWALAAALHYLEETPLNGFPIYPFVVLLLLYPERIWAIVSFSLAHLALLWTALPAAANHSVLALMVDACLLIGCVHALGRENLESRGRRLWESVQGPIRATVAVVYLLAVFHKLNSSFFDPEVSCATSQLAKMFELHGFPERPTNLSAFAFNIYLTLLVEVAIVVLLLWPRFSYVGATVGLVFHTLVGWAEFFDFATVVFALYLFFLPWEGIRNSLAKIPRWAGTCFVSGLVGLAVTSFYFHGIRQSPVVFAWPNWSLQADTLICGFWTLMIWPILLPVFLSRAVRPGYHRWTGAPLAWAIPVIALVNGVTSYLGLKTVANYSMFSNLRTEAGQTNHFLVPAGRFFLAGYQNDLVRVGFVDRAPPEKFPWQAWLAGGGRVRRGFRWLREVPEARVPFMEVRRTIQRWKAIGYTRVSIAYERDGKWYEVEDAFSDGEIMRPLSVWERKLLAFRPVQDDGEASECRW
jgi:hypothetical protein